MLRRQLYALLLCFCLLQTAGCNAPEQEDVSPATETYLPALPSNLATGIPGPERNPLTREGVALGRMLFYDPMLSGNEKISCATCHQQEKAFSDGKVLTTAGVTGKPLLRHVPSLVNLAWMPGLFWDGGSKNLESVSFGPLTHPDEMGQSLKELTAKLQQHEKYPQLFRKAFGSDSVTTAAIGRALAQFQRTLISTNSRYDRYLRKEAGGELSEVELQGLALFRQHCSNCHATDFFTDNSYHNNGLDNTFSPDNEEQAFGRGRITQTAADRGKYKTPTLRNIALTAPYMHDGRFATLEEVLEHYRTGIVVSPTLAPELQQQDQPGIPISETDKQKLIAFLHTLTDKSFIHDKAFSRPE
ncbi:cytochrome-c peroxidase [Pontibacter diazotrophicus]|uniref:Cytochrome-c peroxidase n=1 Tax=Pontibacter diazotrophicus TaxID=1400979 RepID=A0A3D8LA54_9BACT|nr:cytochrome c peroxidase [Pontibacter diazotrophicus]RDV14295.1 cytochrome-c peroxidase [Pontibacter diazotrophicus]